MTSFLSHELRNPSHIISRSAEHLMEELGPQHPCRVDIEAIMCVPAMEAACSFLPMHARTSSPPMVTAAHAPAATPRKQCIGS